MTTDELLRQNEQLAQALQRAREELSAACDELNVACIDTFNVIDEALAAYAASRQNVAQVTDELCPNCVSPWKCNGPHVLAKSEPGAVGMDTLSDWSEEAQLIGKRAYALDVAIRKHAAQAAPAEQEPTALDYWNAENGDLHPATSALVWNFALALCNKLADAEKKYGYTDGWRSKDWEDECRAKLREHVDKGDPRDVAAYCAFMWSHGWSTAAPAQAARAVIDDSDVDDPPDPLELDEIRRNAAAQAAPAEQAIPADRFYALAVDEADRMGASVFKDVRIEHLYPIDIVRALCSAIRDRARELAPRRQG